MCTFLRKWPGLAQPYTPSRDIDWDNKSLDSDRLLRFTDPEVSQEFRVYKHRDLTQILVGLIYSGGGYFFMFSRVGNVGGYQYMTGCLFFGALVAVATVFDLYAFVFLQAARATPGHQQETGETKASKQRRIRLWAKREKLANLRWVIAIVMPILVVAQVIHTATWIQYDKNCVGSPDLFAMIGMRTSPATYYTAEQISIYCSRIISPFNAFLESSAVPMSGATSWWLLPSYALDVLSAGLAELNPRDVPTRDADVIVRWLLTVVLVVGALVIHNIRYRSAMSQFRQEILLRRATDLAAKREEEVDTLMCNMLPLSALERLSRAEPVADSTDEATVLFSDMKGFTAWSSKRSAQEVVAMLNVLTLEIDKKAEAHKVEKVKTIGDAYWAVTGLPDECPDHAEKMCNFGNAMLDVVARENKKHPVWNDVSLRIGIHSGPLNGGILGMQQLSYEVFGQTSSIAEKVEQAGVPGRVMATEHTMHYLGIPEESWGTVTKCLCDFGVVTAPRSFVVLTDADPATATTAGGSDCPLQQTELRLFLIPQTSNAVEALLPVPAGVSLAQLGLDGSMFERSASSVGSNGSTQYSATLLGSEISAGWTKDEAKKKRGEFLARRAAKEAEEDGKEDQQVEEETLEALTAKYSKRKYKHIFFDFADPAVEASFQETLALQLFTLRVASRVAMLAFFVAVLIGIGINEGSFSLVSTILFPISGALALADLGMCFATQIFSPKLQAGIHMAAAFILLLAAGLMPPGSSTATNDVTYMYPVVAVLVGYGNIGFISSATMTAINLTIGFPVTMWLIWSTVMLATHAIFLLLACLILLPNFVVTERLYRLQFLQFHTAAYFKAKQEDRTKEQEALLGSMVPGHIVKELMQWMQTGMDPSKTVVQPLPVTCTAFVQIDVTASSPACVAPARVSPVFAQELLDDPLNPLSVLHKSGAGEEVGNHNGHWQQQSSNHWLQDIHVKVDEALKKFHSVVKIKTVGDVVMLAGPFTSDHDLTTTADEMLAAVNALSQITPVRAGLHCGELVGAVLGNSRLCFDIFGDTVNTASRCMTSGAISLRATSVSEEFYRTLPSTPQAGACNPSDNTGDDCNPNPQQKAWLTAGAVFADKPYEVEAKGKGLIVVWRLTSFST